MIDYDRYVVSSAMGNTIYCHSVEDARREAINESLYWNNDVRIYDTHHVDYGTYENYMNARVAVYRAGLEIGVKV